MKRHISSFARPLFSALASCFLASPAVLAEEMEVWGFQAPGQSEFEPDASRFNPKSASIWPWEPENKVTVTVTPDKGWKVVEWRVADEYVSTEEGNFGAKSKPLSDSAGKLSYTYAPDPIPGASYLGVKFAYITYNVRYDGNGAASPAGKSNVPYANTFTLESAPMREGYDFAGWLASTVGDQPFDAGASVSGDVLCPSTWHADGNTVTLTAQWAAKSYTVSTAGENCSVTIGGSKAYDGDLTISWTPDGSWTKPTVKVYGGSDESGVLLMTYTSGTSATFNMSKVGSYYGKVFVKASYDVRTVVFDANGGECGEKDRRVEFGEAVGKLPEATQHQMTQDGWWTDRSSAGDPVTAVTAFGWPADEVTLYAHWKAVELFAIDTIADPDIGGTVTESGKYEKGEKITLTATANAGYSFEKWTTKTSGEEHYSCEWPITVNGGEQYTAHFTGNVYTVTFHALDGEPDEQTRSFTFGNPLGELPVAVKGDDYELEGWYTKPKGTGIKYDSSSIMDRADDQLALYANWKSIPTYHIAYDGNGSSSDPMPAQKMYCGVPANLTSNTYERGGYHFRGWATNTEDAAALKIAYADGERVTDIAPTNGTATLYAAWESISLAEAMHCDNLEWTNANVPGVSKNAWEVEYGENVGFGTQSCVRQQPETQPYALAAAVTNSGTLAFHWKPENGEGPLIFWISNKLDDIIPMAKRREELYGFSGMWSEFSTNVVVTAGSTNYIHLIYDDFGDSAFARIDLMTWTPGGTHPEPRPEHAVSISSAAVADGKFMLSFDSDERFAYNLLTNANLLIDSWGVMTNEVGTGGTITFKPEVIEGQPQMFYRVDTIQRK